MLHRPFMRRTSGSAGSQALAVLSCALALLAVNPAGLRAGQEAPIPLIRVQGALPASSTVIVEDGPANVGLPATPDREESRRAKPAGKISTGQQSAILQTVALLNAVFIRHFTPLAPQAVLAPDSHVPTSLSLNQPRPIMAAGVTPLPQPYQQTFALCHCLLAPPV